MQPSPAVCPAIQIKSMYSQTPRYESEQGGESLVLVAGNHHASIIKGKIREFSDTGVLSSFYQSRMPWSTNRYCTSPCSKAIPPGGGLPSGPVCTKRGFKAINGMSGTEVLDFTTEPGRPGAD